jgi:hypothetical protein
MVASALKWSGGYVWACKNYDGDVQSDTVAQGFGSLGLMTSRSDDARWQDGGSRSRPRHRDPPLPPAPEGRGNLDQLDRLDLRLDPGLKHRAKLDDNAELATFAETLEKVCIETVEAGFMTKDLALLVGPDQPWLSTMASSTRSTRTCRRPWADLMATGPAVTLKRLWRQNRWLTIAFALTLTLALVFIIRAGVFFVYWQQHQDEPIEGWMTVRYVARSYRVDPPPAPAARHRAIRS